MTIEPRLLEEDAEELYEHAPCGYLSTLPDGSIVKVNQTFLGWVGRSREEVMAPKRFQDLLTVGGRIHYETHFAPLMQMQGSVREVAWELKRRNAPALPVLVSAYQKRDESDRPVLHRVTVFDASQRRAYEREVLQARRRAEEVARSRAEMISTISHDVRSPLQGILTAAHLLMQSVGDGPHRRYVELIRASSEQLLELTDKILDASRLESGRMRLDENPIPLHAFVEGIALHGAHAAEARGIDFRLDWDPSLPDMVLGDSVQLGQVLANLVGNAVKFTAQGSVTLEVRNLDRSPVEVDVEFRVTDTGIGIPPDRLSAIFEEYRQASPDIVSSYGGKGLGLTIARRIVEMHGSHLHVDSTPGQGSAFWFHIRMPVEKPSSGAVGMQALETRTHGDAVRSEGA